MRPFAIIGLSLFLVYLIYSAITDEKNVQNIPPKKEVAAASETKPLPTKQPQQYKIITEEIIVEEIIEEVEQ